MAGSSSGNPELEYQLAVLRVVEGVTGVNPFGKEGSGKQYGVFLWVRTDPEADRQPICACRTPVCVFALQSRAPQGRLKSPKIESGLYTKFQNQGFLQDP